MENREWYEQLVQDARERGDPKFLAGQLGALGNQCAEEGDAQAALKAMNEALEIYKSLRDRKGMALKYFAISGVYEFIMHDYKTAIEYLELAGRYNDDLPKAVQIMQKIEELRNSGNR